MCSEKGDGPKSQKGLTGPLINLGKRVRHGAVKARNAALVGVAPPVSRVMTPAEG